VSELALPLENALVSRNHTLYNISAQSFPAHFPDMNFFGFSDDILDCPVSIQNKTKVGLLFRARPE
jgi:hypothetical protein